MKTVSKILYFFNTAQRKQLFGIFLCIVVMGFIEMVGIATILPFMAVVAKPEVVHSNIVLSSLFQFFQFHETKYFILFLGALVFSFLVLGNAFSAFTSWLMLKFCYRQGTRIAVQILEKYLQQPYAFFLYRNSNDLTKNVLTEVDRLVNGIFVNMVQSLAKIVLIICIFTLLLIVDARLAITVVCVLGSAYLITYTVIRKRLSKAGKLASQVNTTRLQLIHEVVGAIKELKVLGREGVFLSSFKECATQYAKVEALSQLSPLVTRYIIEAIALGGMVLIALYLIATKEDISKFMPLLGLYAFAGYRLMPAMQQIFASATLLKYHHFALDVLCQEMQLPNGQGLVSNAQGVALKASFELKEVHYCYEGSEKAVLRNINLTVKRHQTVGIVGTSGAGKTTLVDLMLGLLSPTQGALLVDNQALSLQHVRAWQQCIGYVPQTIFLLDASIAHNIAIGVHPHQIDQVALEKAAKLANLHDFILNELPLGYHTLIGERGVRLSGGQRQRIGIARALYHDPELLIFDEATSALDSLTEKIIMEAIHTLAHRKTIILIAHRLNTVKACDEIYVLSQGEIVGQGCYEQLLNTNATFKHLANAFVGLNQNKDSA